jgi:acyl carrier protein
MSDGKNLRTDLGLDSVDVVSIVSQVERRFRIRLSQQDLEKLVTVGDVLDLLQSKLNEAAAAPKAA